VPRGHARIRPQTSAAHTVDDIEMAARAFATSRDERAAT
jgi:7-keto-8-aminopelargonate synthetase-like enzyme